MYDGENFRRFVELNMGEYKKAIENDSEMKLYDLIKEAHITPEEYAIRSLSTFSHIIGKTKIDKTMRISLISEVAEMLDARPGEEIEYEISGFEVKIRKVTTPFEGFNVADDIIRENIVDYIAKRRIEMDQKIKKDADMKNKKPDDYDEIRKKFIEQRKKN